MTDSEPAAYEEDDAAGQAKGDSQGEGEGEEEGDEAGQAGGSAHTDKKARLNAGAVVKIADTDASYDEIEDFVEELHEIAFNSVTAANRKRSDDWPRRHLVWLAAAPGGSRVPARIVLEDMST
jgi:hypothetical protein